MKLIKKQIMNFNDTKLTSDFALLSVEHVMIIRYFSQVVEKYAAEKSRKVLI